MDQKTSSMESEDNTSEEKKSEGETSYKWGCYLVISPDPEDGNYIHVSNSIKSNKGPLKGSNQVHYVKFGDEKGFLETVGAYTRANPNIWFICIGVKELVLSGKANDKKGFGKLLEDSHLKDHLEFKPDQGKEWYICQNGLSALQKLIRKIEKAKEPIKSNIQRYDYVSEVITFDTDSDALDWFGEALKELVE